jgi:hypothetical protein
LPEWSTTGEKTITVRAIGSNGVQLLHTIYLDVVYMQFLPLTMTPFAPQAGYWDTEDGYFFVTEDHKNIYEFSVYFYIPNCGSARIYTTDLVPITNNSFSFNNFTTYYATGVFDSATTGSGVYGLDNVYIYPCEVYWTIPTTNWTGTAWEGSSQRLYAPYEPDHSQEANLPYRVELLGLSK